MQKNTILKGIEINQIAPEGKGITRLATGAVLFVSNAIPGDVVDVKINKVKSDYLEGTIHEIIKPSEFRQTPFCKHFGTCGGCKWQYLNYLQQANYKQLIVEDTFKRIAKINNPPILPIINAQPTTEYYRNKLEYTFSNKKWLTTNELTQNQDTNLNALGFHVPGFFDKIVHINHCYLQANPSNNIRNEIFNYAQKHKLTFYDIKAKKGFLRNLIIRTTQQQQVMVLISFGFEEENDRTALLNHIANNFPEISSLHYVINPKGNDTIFDLNVVTFKGTGYITENIGDLQYKISPKSFFQTNSYQAQRLYEQIKLMADIKNNQIVYDLYTGTGSIALYIAQQCQQVIGIEEVQASIEDAKVNAKLNNILNAHFYTGDVKKVFTHQLVAQHGLPNVIITDPPRAGMATEVIEQILHLQPEKIVYVSCNPATQARDVQLLADKYEVISMQPVDMFPHTFHIENIALCKLRI